ncbi:MAG: MFS transporter [Conexivisphaera sp.]
MARWLYSWLLIGAVSYALSMLAPLLILELRGTVIDVSLASFAYYASSMIGSILWGWMADVVPRRRLVLTASAAGLAATPMAMALSGSIAGVIVWYAVGAFLYASLAVYLNLLVVETTDRGQWSENARRGFLYLVTGSALGTALGLAAAGGQTMLRYAEATAAAGAAASAMLYAFVREPPMILERRALLSSPHVFVSRLASLPMIFLNFPRLFDINVLRKRIRRIPGSELTVLTLVNALFSISAQMFFTVYIPYEESVGLSERQVLLSYLYMSSVNALVAVLLADELRRPDYKLASRGMGLRALGMLAAAAFSTFVSGQEALYATMLSFTFIAFAYTVITVTMNALLYATLIPGTRGRSLGAYSTVGSLSFMAGALLSGAVVSLAGYQIAFFLGAIVLMVAAAAMEFYYRSAGSTIESVEVY